MKYCAYYDTILIPDIEIKNDKRTGNMVEAISNYIKMRMKDKKSINEIKKEIDYYVSDDLKIFKAYLEIGGNVNEL